MTEEELKERKRISQKRWYEKQKAKKLEQKKLEQSNNETTTDPRIEEFKKLCEIYKAQAEAAHKELTRATLEYNTRIKYMQDAVKHAYLSIQFATNAINNTPKGENYND